MSEDPIGAGDVGWLQQRARAIAPREQWPGVDQFFADLVPCAGLATLDATGAAPSTYDVGLGCSLPTMTPCWGRTSSCGTVWTTSALMQYGPGSTRCDGASWASPAGRRCCA